MLYLADFTHSDSTLDYIVNVTPGFDWQYVEIPSNIVDSVVFKLESSDMGAFGMNTPDFFCMDNVGSYPLSVNSENEISIEIFPNPTSDFIYLNSANNLLDYNVNVYDIFGKIVVNNLRNINKIDLGNLPNGQYLININLEGKIKSEIIIKK
jgi:hypothetical protein